MSVIERRSEPRQEVLLDAILHPEHGRTWPCTIVDFCVGGMLLSGEQGSRRALKACFSPQRDEVVHIHFTVPAITGSRNFRLTAQVARVLDNGIGVYFPDGMALRAFQALEGYAKTPEGRRRVMDQRDGDPDGSGLPRLPEKDAETARKLLRELSEQALPQLMQIAFERIREDLVIQARDAGNNVRQNVMMGALTVIEESHRKVSEQVVNEVLGQIDEAVDLKTLKERRYARGQQGERRLSLVDTDAFEDWLLVADVISRAESRYSQDLLELSLRLAMVVPAWQEKDGLPVSPTVISAAFDEALKDLEFDRDVRQVVFGCFRDVLIAFLRRFYAALKKTLEKSGLFPPVEELVSASAKKKQKPAPAAEVDEGGDDEGPAEGAPRGPARGGSRGGGGGQPVVWEDRRQAPQPPQPGEFTQQFAFPAAALAAAQAEAGAYQSPTPVRGGRRAPAPIGNVYGAARELMQLQRALPGPDGLPTEAPWSDEVHAAPETMYSEEEILAAFDRIAAQQVDVGAERVPLRRRLAKELAAMTGGQRMFSPQQRDALEVVDGLLESVRDDGYLPLAFSHWVDRLEVPFSKLATEDAEFLDTSATPMHPALRLLDGLAELGSLADAGDGMDPAVQQKVDKLLGQVARDYDGGPAVFEHALEEIEPLLKRQRRSFHGALQRVARQSEGSYRLVRARRDVMRELGTRLSGRDVPELVLKLLNPGWRNLLVHCQLRHGIDSEEWRTQIELVDRLTTALAAGKVERSEAEMLIASVSEGLESIAFDPGRRGPLIESLQKALLGEAEAGPSVQMQPENAASLLGLEDQLPDPEPKPEGIDDAEDRRKWELWRERAKELQVGTWLSEQEDTGRSRILTIAWIGEDHSAFTLINRKGVKVHDYDLKDLVAGLHEGRLAILDEADQPLTERASQRMLQNMHNQLAYQATHDALTGLMNRKEYERRVEQAVVQAETSDVEHAVLFFDLDQFKVINNTSGHDAGDELLRALVPRLRHELRSVRSVLARLGGDEFGVLLERCSREEGEALAQALRRSISEFRFEWGEREYAVTASVGFVPFRNDGRDAATLMQQADQACYAAKDGGRNRVQVFDVQDRQLAARRGVMEWVAEVDRILKEDRIRLTAQRIAPIGQGGDGPSHYEVLMTVLDEKGKPMPPLDFITAAETYNRMPTVERWIVAHALEWMAMHMEWLEEVHGFSINLSGSSLNDEGFLNFCVSELQRTRVPTSKITFEITETTAITSMEGARRFMRRLNDLGCTFSLDDFGTGLASYSYLRNLEVDFVKIDGVFVKDLIDNPADYAVVKSVNEIAHFMGKQTIAECVENEAILERLREIGVDYAQGWGIEKPRALIDFFR